MDRLASNGYGELSDGQLTLSPVETLYLLEKGSLTLHDSEGAQLDFKTLLDRLTKSIPNIWPIYIIYRDLRRSGKIVRKGFGGKLAFRLYEQPSTGTSKFVVLSLPEGSPLKIEELLRASRQVMKKGKILVIAAVERRGEVIYYSCSDTSLSNL